jgi:hypothetical protein
LKKKATESATRVALVWEKAPASGSIDVVHGTLGDLRLTAGKGKVSGSTFRFSSPFGSLVAAVRDARLAPGAGPTMVRVAAGEESFTFFLRDVNSADPIFIPAFGVAVLPADDLRRYEEIQEGVQARNLLSIHQAIEAEPEETYENASAGNRKQMCPTWLGLGRDMRFFEVSHHAALGYWGYVQPRYHSTCSSAPETEGKPYALGFVLGPGAGCRVDIQRRLEEGYLPILHSTQREEAIHYHLTAFTTLEKGPVSERRLRGSDWRACYPNTGGQMLKQEEREKLKDVIEAEMHGREEETVCWIRAEAVNTTGAPAYAWFKVPSFQYDGVNGFSTFASGRVLCVNRLDGKPVPQCEMAVLVPPGQAVVLDMLMPHQPLPPERARKLAQLDFEEHLGACRTFWKKKLAAAASISVPEAAVDERIKAGLLHCDIATLGKEPDGTLMATIGWYSPIGSESSPIIQFFDSMGWHDVAERSLQFFLDRQREDGFIQNFGGYQLETGPALWSMGEHYRYTRDKAWVRRIKPQILKSCQYLLAWRERNKREELRGRGYGLLDGKVADPEDYFHSFMLNALSYLGVVRVAEMLGDIDPIQSRRLAKEAAEFKADIRTAYYESLARSPVIPMGNGTWLPTVPPWAEYSGPVALFADGGEWFTHGGFGGRDALIGSLYLVIGEILEPHERGTETALRMHQQLFTAKNAGVSQPYYCRHDQIHLRRGEVKEFLKAYYNQFTALQDRETYTFWEHYYGVSQHKTHEEGWFLMQTRWMLWMEEGDSLRLLNAIPRRWMEDGKRIELRDVATYFGPLSLTVQSALATGTIEAEVRCAAARRPATLVIRLPHPERRNPCRVEGGAYDAATESVRVERFTGRARVKLFF